MVGVESTPTAEDRDRQKSLLQTVGESNGKGESGGDVLGESRNGCFSVYLTRNECLEGYLKNDALSRDLPLADLLPELDMSPDDAVTTRYACDDDDNNNDNDIDIDVPSVDILSIVKEGAMINKNEIITVIIIIIIVYNNL